MSLEHNKTIVHRLLDQVYTQGKVAAIDELIAEAYVGHRPLPGQPPGRVGFHYAMRQLRTAFPDHQVTIDDMIAEGDLVAIRVTARGTQQGLFLGISPSGKHAVWTGMLVLRIEDSKVTDIWNVWDALGMFQQLGHLPKPTA